tara:strand:- start:58 stop:1464 length:1407 start_codon:yes stop_codon:yes gene_type:complete
LNFISAFDLIYALILLCILPRIFRGRVKRKNPELLKYYNTGVYTKLIGTIFFCSVYIFYYGGGDTTNYFIGVRACLEVLLNNPLDYLKLLVAENGVELNAFFYEVKSYPPIYMLRDSRTMAVIKLSSIFAIPGLGGFYSTSIIISLFSFSWIWKFYIFFRTRYPNKTKAINLAVLYLPSSIFWASGIMKDTYTFCATCFVVFAVHKIFIEKKRNFNTFFQLILALYIIITMKSYIMFALLPGLLIFTNFERVKKIKSKFVKIIFLPFAFFIALVIANALLFNSDDLFGKYSADNLLNEAAVQNADLKRSVYGENSFDIGTFEPTFDGILSVFIPAISASLFRPYITEVNNTAMLLSGLENTLTLGLAIWALLTQPFSFLKSLRKDSFLIFCLLFTLTLAFGVGVSAANFGALVRYKIPFLPFFIFLLLNNIKRLDNKVSPDNLSSKIEATDNQINDDNFLINQSRKFS